MNKHLLLIAALIASTTLNASPVDESQARREAISFLQTTKHPYTSTVNGAKRAHTAASDLQTVAENSTYYIFNIGRNQGFVIVSGDDRVPPVLGYTDEGCYDSTQVPVALQELLRHYEKETKALSASSFTQAKARKITFSSSESTKNAVSPLLSSRWGQNTPYNARCPAYSESAKSTTGCVATAMAQIMNYYQYPAKILSTIPAYTSYSHSVSLPGVLAGTAIDWSNIQNNYSGATSEIQKAAIADLMLYVGESINMDYGPSSGAADEAVPAALTKFFGYDNSIRYVLRSEYSARNWDNLIFNELSNGRPVMYGGFSSSGHSFVVDGYDGDGLYHINWGWNGVNNGYFKLSILNPSAPGADAIYSSEGYINNQIAIIGIKPDDHTAETGNEPAVKINRASVKDNQISCFLTSNLAGTASVDYGIGILSGDGTILPVTYKTTNWIAGTMRNGNDALFSVSGLAEGIYQLIGISRLSSSDKWTADISYDLHYIMAYVDASGNIFLSEHPQSNLTASNLTFSGANMANSQESVTFDLINNGEEFNGRLYLFAGTDENQMGPSKTYFDMALEGGSQQTVKMNFSVDKAGTYTIILASDDKGEHILGKGTVAFAETEASTSQSLAYSSSSIKSAKRMSIVNFYAYTNSLIGYFTIENKDTLPYIGGIKVQVTSDNNEAYVSYYNGIVPAKGTANIPINVKDLTYGTNYIVALYYKGTSKKVSGAYFYFDIFKGITMWDNQGNFSAIPSSDNITVPDTVYAVSVAGTKCTKITPNANPNTLYYIDEHATVSGIEGKNVVRGDTAENIILNDDYGFYAPESFIAREACYTRQVNIGYDKAGNNGWETLVLPFAPTEIYDEESRTTRDWFHKAEETGKYIWIREYSKLEGRLIYFRLVDKMEANRPYIFRVLGDKYDNGKYSWNIAGHHFQFRAYNTEIKAEGSLVTSSNSLSFSGTTVDTVFKNAYVLNEGGNKFCWNESAGVNAFRACFKNKSLQSNIPDELEINGNQPATGIDTLTTANTANSNGVYMLNGVKINSGNLPKGIYIKNGKKIIK